MSRRSETQASEARAGERTSHSQRAQATTTSRSRSRLTTHVRAAPPVSDGHRRCFHGVSAVWPCVAPPTWSRYLRSQEYTSSIAEDAEPSARRVRGRAANAAAHPETLRNIAGVIRVTFGQGEDRRVEKRLARSDRSIDEAQDHAISVRCRVATCRYIFMRKLIAEYICAGYSVAFSH